ncbi:MAG: DUF6090 family protein [Saprospiraceae bacterium]|nr:DUF6090 family protein [Saprospiraceae bacterium]
MLPFFRRIRRSLLDSGRLSKYLLYAIGEILLVVLGILIALQINNWNAAHKLKAEERAILEDLDKNLQSNVGILETFIKQQQLREQEIQMIIEHIDLKLPMSDSLAANLRRVRMGENLALVTSAYESLKSTGFDLISSKTLRLEIIQLFNYVYERNMKQIHEISQAQYRSTHDVYVRSLKFESESNGARVVPNHYPSFLDNQELYNLLTFRVAGKAGVIAMARNILSETVRVKELFNQEFEKLQ